MRRRLPSHDRETDGTDAEADELRSRPSDVAVIGMASVFPGAGDSLQFWSNTLRGVDAITEIPSDRWDWRLYYDPDPKAPDKIVSKWGGFVPDVAFDPLKYGMPPSSLPSIEPAQLLALEVVRKALADAGYADRDFPREQTAVVLGMGGGAAQLAMGYAFRSYLPMLDTVIPGGGEQALASCRGLLPEWTEDSFPGFLLNVTAGRIANRFNLGGANYTVDAACGSSLAAAALAVRELESGSADMVILGGVDTVQNPFTYLAFSKTQAFSPRGRCRPFDAGADGIVISEGVAALVLKRLADAERDGDRIYAVIKGVGASSDGRARGLTAPVVDGQVRAIERAYTKAAVSPSTVGYVEAHGTGTALGDVVEIEALGEVFRTAGAVRGDCVVGSVKSLIGHTKCAAGLAGLINASLALHHKVLPPTIGIESPNPKLDLRDGPFRLCTEAQPWLHPHDDRPRRAGVSAFGFGGTNFHAVLEAYERNKDQGPASSLAQWPMELMVLEADQTSGLIEPIDRLIHALQSGSRPLLRDLSDALIRARAEATPRSDRAVLAIVAGSHDDLREKLIRAREILAEGRSTFEDPRGVFFAARPEWVGSRVAFLFPGQGSQTPGMLRELAVVFPEIRGAFEEFERLVASRGGAPLGPLVFPPPAFDDEAREELRRALMQTDAVQPAIGAACVGMLRLLLSLGLEPDMVAGHSYGELVALHAAGVMDAVELAEVSIERGRLMQEAGRGASGAMAALKAGPEAAAELIRDIPDLEAANWNGPGQTVIAGPSEAVLRAVEVASGRGMTARALPVSCAFHTRMIAGVRDPLARFARDRIRHSPDLPVYSNLDAAPHPADPSAIAVRLGEHLASPVRFGEMIAAMYRDGARVFVEVGPGSILGPLVETVLHDRPHLAISCDAPSSPGVSTLLMRIARLLVAGLPLRLERLTAGRSQRRLDLDHLSGDGLAEPASASTWLVNGSRARPISAPEPSRLGTGPVLPKPGPQVGPKPQPASRTDLGLRTPPRPDVTRHPAAVNGTPVPAAASSGASHRAGIGTVPVPSLAKSRRGVNGRLDSTMTIKTMPVPSQATAPGRTDQQADRVMESFQKTMQAFLDVQKTTMLAYLSGRAAPPTDGAQDVGCPVGTDLEKRNGTNGHTANHDNGVSHVAVSRQPEAPRNPPPAMPADAREDHRKNGAPSHSNGAKVYRNGKPSSPSPVPEPVKPVVEEPRTVTDSPAPDRASITARLLEIVRDRTGYPIETLGLDLDMEADLGIDSIKRVEILGKLRDEFPNLKGLLDSAEVVDTLTRAHALGEIVDRMTALAQSKSSSRPGGEGDPEGRVRGGAGHHPDRPAESVRKARAEGRRVLEAIDAPLPAERLGLMPGGRVMLTEDGRGVAATVARHLEAAGIPAERIGGPDRPVDWTSPAAIDSVIDEVRSCGPIAGIVHAMPLGQSTSGDPAGPCWTERIGDGVKGLFLLAKGTAADLEAAARAGGSCLIAATALGGRLSSAGSTQTEFFPGHGGIAGLVKTLAREWPSVRCRVVDFAIGDDAATRAGRLAEEVFIGDGWAEVGYDGGRRIRLRTVESPLRRAEAPIELKPGDPVVITGGARGITALVAVELARAWRPKLLIVGTTPPPGDTETPETAGLVAEAEIKSALLAQLRREGSAGRPAEIEASYQAIRRAREVRENLAILRESGAHVEYARADVRDPAAMAAVLGGWRARHGDPVGLIHGAGLIKDKLIREKTLESFDRVLGTKLEGALNLIRLVRPESLKFTAMFSSIAGRFGNVGQSDYASANEILNKLAQWLDRRWPGRVVSVIWGPWSGVGMVSQLEGHLGRRGLGMISPETGRTLLLDELRHGRKGDVEILYTGGLGTLEDPLPIAAPEAVR